MTQPQKCVRAWSMGRQGVERGRAALWSLLGRTLNGGGGLVPGAVRMNHSGGEESGGRQSLRNPDFSSRTQLA